MWMEFTPKDWLMIRVGLIFCEGDPDPEDAWVRSYLDAHQLAPRHQEKEERDGITCEVLYFGQCYLGQHLRHLQELYQKGLERSLIMEKLRELRRSPNDHLPDCLTGLDDGRFEACLPALAEALHPGANFSTDSDDYPTVTLDLTLVADETTRLMMTSKLTSTMLTRFSRIWLELFMNKVKWLIASRRTSKMQVFTWNRATRMFSKLCTTRTRLGRRKSSCLFSCVH